jgi:hypothetical protein
VVFVALGIVLIFGWPLILLGLDLAWLIAVAGVGAITRLVLRRPWRVEAVAGGERRQCSSRAFAPPTATGTRSHGSSNTASIRHAELTH